MVSAPILIYSARNPHMKLDNSILRVISSLRSLLLLLLAWKEVQNDTRCTSSSSRSLELAQFILLRMQSLTSRFSEVSFNHAKWHSSFVIPLLSPLKKSMPFSQLLSLNSLTELQEILDLQDANQKVAQNQIQRFHHYGIPIQTRVMAKWIDFSSNFCFIAECITSFDY
ncbi:hypothetical protein OSB04_027561 [Centaurea solstitialis]|uniref:Uncharacterized protein n=1 Tax=Centaurea solstitialis TaxID=347529 RepID=A0AA38W6Z0_9ASTR|nr:hypothetical protein OSB04_027561 [Centaurea solstitialis]